MELLTGQLLGASRAPDPLPGTRPYRAALLLAVALAACRGTPSAIACRDDADCLPGSICACPAGPTCEQRLCAASAPPSLSLSPAAAVTAPLSTLAFQVQGQVTWSVREDGGGTIDAQGSYTAPLQDGVYTVVATSIAFPESSATATVKVQLAPVLQPPAAIESAEVTTVAILSAGSGPATFSWTLDGAAPERLEGPVATFVAGQVPQVTITCTATAGGRAASTTVVRPVVLAARLPEIEYPDAVPADARGVSAFLLNPIAGVEYQWFLRYVSPSPGAAQPLGSGRGVTFDVDGGPGATQVQVGVEAKGVYPGPIYVPIALGPLSADPPGIWGPTALLSGEVAQARVQAPLPGVTYRWTISGGSFLDGASAASGRVVSFRPGAGAAQVSLTLSASHAPAATSTLDIPVSDRGLMQLGGRTGGAGRLDGPGGLALFDRPFQLASDGQGGAFVLEKGSSTVRRAAADGTVSTLAGAEQPGSSDGPGPAARFSGATAIAAAGGRTVFVADERGLRRLSLQADGSWQVDTVLAGFAARSLAAQDETTLYALTAGAQPVVRLSSAGGAWSAQPVAASAALRRPGCLGLWGSQTLLVVDAGLRMLDLASGAWTTPAAGGYQSPAGLPTPDFQSSGCQVVQLDRGNVFYTDPVNDSVQQVALSQGVWQPTALAHWRRTYGYSRFDVLFPAGLAPAGNHLLVADQIGHRILTLSAGVMDLLAGHRLHTEAADGPTDDSAFTFPVAVARLEAATDGGSADGGSPDGGGSSGSAPPLQYDCDAFEVAAASGVSRVTASDGGTAVAATEFRGTLPCPQLTSLTSFGGDLVLGSSGQSCAALSMLSLAGGPSLHPFQNVSAQAPAGLVTQSRSDWSCAFSSTDCAWRRILVADPGAGAVLGGWPAVQGSAGATGWSASLADPFEINPHAWSAPHAVADGVVASAQGIWRYTEVPPPTLNGPPTFALERIAGADDDQPGGWVDGEGASARFRMTPWHGFWPMIATDAAGSVYVADSGNHAIRKVAQDAGGRWRVTTLAGGPDRRGVVPGASPSLNTPLGLAVRCDGRIVIADPEENAILLLAP